MDRTVKRLRSTPLFVKCWSHTDLGAGERAAGDSAVMAAPCKAGEAPRVEHVGSATPTGRLAKGVGVIQAERGIPDDVVRELERRGHRVQRVRVNGGGYQAILIDPRTGMLHGGTEARKDGCAAGY